MIYSFQAAILACLTATASASPLLQRAADFGPSTVFEKVNIPKKWTPAGTPSAQATMTMQIALKQNNIVGLQAKLSDIANPKSPNYGKWLSKQEMETYTHPSNDSVQAVTAWLTSYGVSSKAITQPTPDWMYVQVPLTQAETILSTQYTLYKDASGTTVPRTSEYSIPTLLQGHINTIQPTTAFHLSKFAPQAAGNSRSIMRPCQNSNCYDSNVTPSCIQNYYNVDYTGTSGQSTLAVTGFQGIVASHEDAASFLQQYDSQASGTDFTEISVSSGTTGDTADPEGNLDTQSALGLGYPNTVQFLSVGPSEETEQGFQDELVNFGTYLNSASSPPSVVSSSYGDEEENYSNNYLDSICNEFMKAGSLGVSVLFSSGDSGVGGNGETDCSNGYYPVFPASCPYVTAVGATQFYSGGEEVAIFQGQGSTPTGSSGGGFSNYFSMPSYQSSDVQSYINGLNGASSGLYNANGRGYPDVALIGLNLDIVYQGSVTQIGGTSASFPEFAALISQINDYRISEGKSTLGFLNPALYSADSSSFNDITVGSNEGCNTNGFPATTGWDAATGLGSMNFANLRQALG